MYNIQVLVNLKKTKKELWQFGDKRNIPIDFERNMV